MSSISLFVCIFVAVNIQLCLWLEILLLDDIPEYYLKTCKPKDNVDVLANCRAQDVPPVVGISPVSLINPGCSHLQVHPHQLFHELIFSCHQAAGQSHMQHHRVWTGTEEEPEGGNKPIFDWIRSKTQKPKHNILRWRLTLRRYQWWTNLLSTRKRREKSTNSLKSWTSAPVLDLCRYYCVWIVLKRNTTKKVF